MTPKHVSWVIFTLLVLAPWTQQLLWVCIILWKKALKKKYSAVSTLTFVYYRPTSCIAPTPPLCSHASQGSLLNLVRKKNTCDWLFSKVARCFYCLHAADHHRSSCMSLRVNEIPANYQESNEYVKGPILDHLQWTVQMLYCLEPLKALEQNWSWTLDIRPLWSS